MTTAYTPGPWKLEDRDDGAEGYVLRGANDDMIEYIERSRYFHNIADPEQEANARLIAAAPELLEALEACVSALTELYGEVLPDTKAEGRERVESDPVLVLARDVIAKARGEA